MFLKRNTRLLLTLMIALMLLFIWSNSLANSVRSNALSGWVERWLKPLIDPQGNIPDKTFDYDVRKFAHLFEYALLGALLVFGTAQSWTKTSPDSQYLPTTVTICSRNAFGRSARYAS